MKENSLTQVKVFIVNLRIHCCADERLGNGQNDLLAQLSIIAFANQQNGQELVALLRHVHRMIQLREPQNLLPGTYKQDNFLTINSQHFYSTTR